MELKGLESHEGMKVSYVKVLTGTAAIFVDSAKRIEAAGAGSILSLEVDQGGTGVLEFKMPGTLIWVWIGLYIVRRGIEAWEAERR